MDRKQYELLRRQGNIEKKLAQINEEAYNVEKQTTLAHTPAEPPQKREYVCAYCGEGWFSKMNPPNVCPYCHNEYTPAPPPLWHCLQCGHVWRGRGWDAPSICPKCKSQHHQSYEVQRLSLYGKAHRDELAKLYRRIKNADTFAGWPLIWDTIFGNAPKAYNSMKPSDMNPIAKSVYTKLPIYSKRMRYIKELDAYRVRKK